MGATEHRGDWWRPRQLNDLRRIGGRNFCSGAHDEPDGRGLFSKAISQSGGGTARFMQAGAEKDEAERFGSACAAMVGGDCDAEVGAMLERSLTAAFAPMTCRLSSIHC